MGVGGPLQSNDGVIVREHAAHDASRSIQGSDERRFRWHGYPIRTVIPLGLPEAESGMAAELPALTIEVDEALGMPPSLALRRSVYTGFELHGDAAECWLAREDLRFRIRPEGIRLSAWPEPAEVEYLRTRVLALWLHQVGAPPLHASAVARKGSALAFLGVSGAGKSTLCAAMRGEGFEALADDLLPIALDRGEVRIYPGHGHVHLWPDSAEHLLGDISHLARIPAQGEKRRVPASAEAPARLRAVLCLRRQPPLDEARLRRLPGPVALLELLRHGQMAGCAKLLGLAGTRMQQLSAALGAFAVYELSYPDRLDALPETCRMVASLLE